MNRITAPIIAILLALVAASIVIAIAGAQPLESLHALILGAFGTPQGIVRTLAKATPLIFTGLSVALALRAGLFNIGAEGQLLVGAMAAAYVGAAPWQLYEPLRLPLALVAGALAGAAWGMLPGLLKAWRGAHEVIVTIMMNYLAILLTHYLANGPLKDLSRANANLAPKTARVLPGAQLWGIVPPGYPDLSAGFVLGLICAALVWFVIAKTSLGFRIRAVGTGPVAARTAGMPVGRTIVTAMSLAGGLAGLAGAVEVLGVHHRFIDQFSPGYGFDSIAVALLGGLNSIGVVLSAILFGGLYAGANAMEIQTGVPRQIAGIVQAVVILAVGARYLRRNSE